MPLQTRRRARTHPLAPVKAQPNPELAEVKAQPNPELAEIDRPPETDRRSLGEGDEGAPKASILILTNVFPCRSTSNKGFYLYEQVRRLAVRFDVTTVVGIPRNLLRRRARPSLLAESGDGMTIVQPEFAIVPNLSVPFNWYPYLRAVLPIVEGAHSRKPFRLIVAYWTYPDGLVAAKIASRLGLPLIIRPRGSDINLGVEKPYLTPQIKRALARADRIIPVSAHLERRVRSLGVPEEKTRFIHNGVDPTQFPLVGRRACRRVLGLELDAEIVAFAGCFRKVKGIIPYLKAIRLLEERTRQPLRFLFLGDGPLRDRIEAVARTVERVSIRICGDISHRRLYLWLNAADVLCLPSLAEGCPNVVLESFACGLPVVASRVGGVPELIDRSSLGILVPPNDPATLADALEVALEKCWDRHLLRQHVQDRSWDEVGRQLMGECERLLSSAHPHQA